MLELDIKTRFMTNADFDRVIEIDLHGGEYSWEPGDLYEEWKKQNGVGIVAIDMDDFPMGFCVYSLEEKECYEVKHMAVDRNFRRLGIGTSLINRMKDKLNDRRYILSYSVPEENLGFQLFLKKMDFKAKLIRHGSVDFLRFQYEKV